MSFARRFPCLVIAVSTRGRNEQCSGQTAHLSRHRPQKRVEAGYFSERIEHPLAQGKHVNGRIYP
jgi:hypothetical protein